LECEWRVCVSSTDALVGHSWAYGEICVLLTHLSRGHLCMALVRLPVKFGAELLIFFPKLKMAAAAILDLFG